MVLLEAARLALATVRAYRLRTFFMVLGTTVGVTFLIAVVTLIHGMDVFVREDLARKLVGLNTVTLRADGPTDALADAEQVRAKRRSPPLRFEDAAWLARQVRTPGVVSFSVEGRGRVSTPTRDADQVRIVAAPASYFEANPMAVQAGRIYTSIEEEQGASVVVLGSELAELLFPGVPVLGRTVRIMGVPLRVIGVLEKQGSAFGISLDQIAIAPARSPLNGVLGPRGVADEILFKVSEESLLPVAKAEMEEWMRVRRGLRPGARAGFEVSTSDAALALWNKISQVMLIALPGLVGISLVVGAVVIMNIMFVSVTERTREIGIRKSLGARRRDILLQFLVEAGTLSSLGGMLGIGVGIALAALVSSLSPLPARVEPWSLLLALALSLGVGITAGVLPARRASRLQPIDALRHE